MLDKSNIDYTLYLVTDRMILGKRDLFLSVEEAIKGGVSIVQLREKNISTLKFYKLAEKIKVITDKYNVPLIINDRVDIALAINSEGLHIGQDDMPTSIARELLGMNKILGVSTSNLKESLKAEKEGADYLGVGAVFITDTKDNTNNVSVEELRKIKSSVNIPVVGIGGINETNIHKVIERKIDGVAVASAILGKKNIFNASRRLYNIMSK